jgi:hypothetical protein
MAVSKTIDVMMRSQTEQFNTDLRKSARIVSEVGSSMRSSVSSVNVFGQAFLQASKETLDLQAAMAVAEKRLKESARAFEVGAIDAATYAEVIEQVTRDTNAAAAGFGSMAAAQQRANAIMQAGMSQNERYAAKVRELNTLRKLGALGEADYATALQRTQVQFGRTGQTLQSVHARLGQTTKSAAGLGSSLTMLATAAPGLNGTATSLASVAATGGPIAAAGVALAGIALTLHSAINEVDRVSDIATEIGADPTELLALEAAAKQTGVSIDQLQVGLEKMTVRAAEAMNGSKEAAAIFQRLGVSAAEINQLTPEAGFRRLADAFAAIPNAGERAALAVKMFGKGNIELLDTLELGSKGLEEIRKQSILFGNVVTEQAKRAADEWERSVGVLKTAWNGLEVSLASGASAMIIGISAVTEKLGETIAFSRAAVTGDMYTAAQIAGWEDVNVAAAKATKSVEAVAEATRRAAEASQKIAIANKMKEVAEQQELYNAKLRESDETIRRIVDEDQKLLDGLREQLDPASKIVSKMDEYLERVRELNRLEAAGLIGIEERNKLLHGAFARLREPTEEAKAAMKARQEALAKLKSEGDRVRESLESPMDRLQKRAADLQRLRGAGAIDMGTYARAMQAITREAIDGIQSNIKEVQPPAALERGTQAAFSAFQENRDSMARSKAEFELQKRIEKHLANIDRRGIVLGAAKI